MRLVGRCTLISLPDSQIMHKLLYLQKNATKLKKCNKTWVTFLQFCQLQIGCKTKCCFFCFHQPAFCRVCVYTNYGLRSSCRLTNKINQSIPTITFCSFPISSTIFSSSESLDFQILCSFSMLSNL